MAADGDDPLTLIARAAEQAQVADQELIDAVGAARTAGYSWTEIGGALGVTKQAAWYRFGRPV